MGTLGYSLKKYRINLVILIIISLILSVLKVLGPYLFQKFIDSLELLNDEPKSIVIYAITYLLQMFLSFGILFIKEKKMYKLKREINYDTRKLLINKYGSLDFEKIENTDKGQLLNLINTNTEEIGAGISTLIPNISMDFVSIILMFFILGSINLYLSGFLITLCVIIASAMFFYKKKSINVFENINDASIKLNGILSSIIYNLNGLKRNDSGGIYRLLSKRGQEYFNAHTEEITLKSLLYPINSFVFYLIIAFAFYFKFNFSAGIIYIFIKYLQASMDSVNNIISFTHSYQGYKVNYNKIEIFLNLAEEEPGIQEFESNIENILVENISFKYINDVKVIKNMNFEMNAGKLYLFVGENGSGKSTTINLLLRLLEPTEGNIFINGTNLNILRKNSIRKKIGLTSSTTVLYGHSVKEILAPADNYSTYLLERSLRLINKTFYNDTLTLASKIDVEKLSEGQKQFISILRNIVMGCSVLVLDEATNSIDYNNELQLIKFIKEHFIGITIIISHRLSLTDSVDYVVFFNDGNVSAPKTHDELSSSNNVYLGYREIWDNH